MKEWLTMTAGDLGRGIGSGEIGSVALTETYLAAIDAHPQRDRIYARVTHDRALAEAEAADARVRAGYRLGLLDGVPVSWKDLFDTAGIATEAGSALLAGRVPAEDADAVKAGSRGGLVCLGKTHLSELAFSGLGLNPVTATPPNVNNPAWVPGGSSSGAGSSVAFGLAAIGIGSDTGGSVRIPAAWNDLVGLKTTHGRLSTRGAVPLCETLDTVGPLTRNVEDAALAFSVLSGEKPVDLAGARLKGMRFLIPETVMLDDLRDEPAKAFEDAVARLIDAGAEITRSPAPELADALSHAGVLFAAEAYAIWKDTIEAAPEKMFPRILDRFRSGATPSAVDYVAANRGVAKARAEWEARVAGFDAAIMPTSPILPPDAERLMTDDDYYVRENLLALRNTRIGNLLGIAALSLPTTVPSAGLQFYGRPYGEERLLRIGAAAERVIR